MLRIRLSQAARDRGYFPLKVRSERARIQMAGPCGRAGAAIGALDAAGRGDKHRSVGWASGAAKPCRARHRGLPTGLHFAEGRRADLRRCRALSRGRAPGDAPVSQARQGRASPRLALGRRLAARTARTHRRLAARVSDAPPRRAENRCCATSLLHRAVARDRNAVGALAPSLCAVRYAQSARRRASRGASRRRFPARGFARSRIEGATCGRS